jgi:hypothetical protein
MLLGGTGFQPVCLYLHRLEAGATQESSMIIALPQRLLLHPHSYHCCLIAAVTVTRHSIIRIEVHLTFA